MEQKAEIKKRGVPLAGEAGRGTCWPYISGMELVERRLGKEQRAEICLWCCPIPWWNLAMTWRNPGITLEQPHGPRRGGHSHEGLGIWGAVAPPRMCCAPRKAPGSLEAPAGRNSNLQEMALPTYTTPSSPVAGVGQRLHGWLYIETRRRFLKRPLWGGLGTEMPSKDKFQSFHKEAEHGVVGITWWLRESFWRMSSSGLSSWQRQRWHSGQMSSPFVSWKQISFTSNLCIVGLAGYFLLFFVEYQKHHPM